MPTTTRKRRYYYANNDNFEQSIDVYANETSKHNIVVILVVGSAWMGHQPWVYYMTSWWNSSGPSTIAELGYRCVCVRHRGAYFVLPHWGRLITFCSLILTIAIAMNHAYVGLALAMFLVFLKITARGSATFDDMLNDVARALKFIQSEQFLVSQTSKIVFGGYSSGGHVAACLLHQQPKIDITFDGILFISPVLATRPVKELSMKPQWLTDFVLTTVWGRQDITSPIHGHIPNIPHLLIGNQKEVFGLNWLDVFFCAENFAAKARASNVPAVYRSVAADHWTILASRGLRSVLQEELPKLVAAQ